MVQKNQRIATIALFIAMAVALHWAESFIPRPAPFLKLGLANIPTLCTLYAFGGAWALFVTVGRVVVGSVLSGSIFTPAFALSLCGGLMAAIVMWCMPKSHFSPMGTSVAGAVAHMLAQILLAALIIRHLRLTNLIPLFLLVSIVTGMINGYCVRMINEVMEGRMRGMPSVED